MMMHKKYILWGATITMAMTAHAQQQKTDTLATANAEGDDRNVMLNAADSYKPREIQIGLPSEDVNVYENGLPVVY